MAITSMLAPSFLPATAVLEMTYHCNHACLFCSCPWLATNNDFDVREELSVLEWQELIGKLCRMGICNIAFTGGEPLLKTGIKKIIEFAANCLTEHIETEGTELVVRKKQPQLYLLSNGKLMNDEILDLCKYYNINLSMSLPGLSTFAEHTQGKCPDGILRWFEKAHSLGVSTTVGVTVTKKNLHELYETIATAFLAGVDTLLINRFLPGGRGLQYAKELSLNTEEIIQMLDIAEEVLRTADRRGSVGTELPKCLVEEHKYTHLQVGTRCSAAIDFFVVDPSGYLRVCNHSPIRLHHIREIEKLKFHPYWKAFVMKEYLPCQCINCKDITSCDGGCREAAHIAGGLVDAIDPLLKASLNRIV